MDEEVALQEEIRLLCLLLTASLRRQTSAAAALPLLRRADEEIFNAKHSADDWNIEIDVLLKRPHETPARFVVIPPVRSWEMPNYAKELCQAAIELAERLHIVIGLVNVAVPVTEVNIGRNEIAVRVEQVTDFRQFLPLHLADIFKYALGNDDVESTIAKLDGLFNKVHLDQVG